MPPNAEAQRIIAALRLAPLPREGGWFRQTWRTAAGSAIYYLMTPDDFSALHRLGSDEIWHFHAGDPVEHVQIEPREGAVRKTRLGPDVGGGDHPQLIVPAGVWQGARIGSIAAGWSLLGCTLAPPWDERHFVLGGRGTLLREFPGHAALVRALTR
jgi:predicted cupin superfamily sugar epimerase